jgi:dipeptidyl aminopeptidase/acylaminoacyl peptidase
MSASDLRTLCLAGVVVAGTTGLALGGARLAPGQAPAGRCPIAPPFHPRRLGAIAYLRGGKLRVVNVGSRRDRPLLRLPRRLVRLPLRPAWSTDGRWIALGDTLVPAAGGAACRPFGAGVELSAWSARTNLLVGVTKGGGLLLGGPGRAARRLLPDGWEAASPVFDPSGKRLAVLRDGGAFIGSVWIVDSRSGSAVKVYASPNQHVGPPVRVSWSPDDRWLLFQNDTERSASLAADGVPLWAVPASGGRALRIEPTVLLAPDFVQPCRGGVVVSAGFDRYVTAHKHLDLAAPPTWRARPLSTDPSRSWYAGACAANGRLVAATVTRNRDEGRFDTAERSIWLLRTDGKRKRLLVGKPGDRISDEFPRWSRDGRFVLYVEHAARPDAAASLHLVNLSIGRRTGPLARIGDGLGYYGYHDWEAVSAWYQP